jgi:hypothetical protein
MKSIRSSSLLKVFVLALGVLGTTVGSAHAQSANGKFTLTHDTRWGSVLLSPGDYTFSLVSPSLPAPIMVGKKGTAAVAVVLPQAVSSEKLTETSTLVLSHDERGESFVSGLHLGNLGLSLHFAAPKNQMPATETAKLAPVADSQTGR